MSISDSFLRRCLHVYYYDDRGVDTPETISAKLDGYPRQVLNNESWPGIPTVCTTSFVIAHTGESILLKFMVSNDTFNSFIRPINGEVHMDNCIEFFISFEASSTYYNIEFNCLGIGKVGYGLNKRERVLLDEPLIGKIRTLTKMNSRVEGFDWEMFLQIPKEVFAFHQINNFGGMAVTGNFYKCGDGLPQPHYLCWSKIIAPEPDFHQPGYFGNIEFLEVQPEVHCTSEKKY